MTDDAMPEAPDTANEDRMEVAEGEEALPRLNQTVDVADIGPCKKHIKVTIDRDDIDARLNAEFLKLTAETPAMVRGFRPGKAPRKMVQKIYKKEVEQQVRGELLLASLEQLADEQDIAPLAPPNLDPSKINIPESGPMIYEFDVEVRPNFQLPEYKGLKLKRPVKTFTDEDIARERDRLLEGYGQLVPKPEPGEIAVGDLITVDIKTKIGDRELNELKEVQVRVDPQLALRDGVAKRFGKEMTGAKAGETRKVKIVLSEAAADAELRGQTIDAAFTVKDVKHYRIPELTPKILKDFGVRNTEALDELIRVALEKRLEYLQRQSARKQIINSVGDEAIRELPQDLLARQARKAIARRVLEMRNAGMKEEDIAGRVRVMQNDVFRSTALALKEHFVLQKIAEDEKMDVSDDDIEAEIERIAARSDESPRKVRARFEKEDLVDSLAAELLETKALDLIIQNAEFEDEPIEPADEDEAVATVEQQFVPGEMQDPLAEETAADEESKPEEGASND